MAIGAAVALASAVGAVGADSRWLAALGREIVENGSVPEGVPFASADSSDWPNVLVAAELLFHWTAALGDHGFLAAQVLAVAIGFGVLAVDARRGGATDAGTALMLLGVAAATLPAITIARVQLFSMALFPILLLLLRTETRVPSRRIWLVVPLIAAWGNLHGAVLVGLAVVSAYLAFERARMSKVEALAVWVASVLAVLVNPALLRTVEYYAGVLTNEAAQRGFGLWEPLSLRSPFDLVFIGIGAAVCALALRARPRLWELVALAGLAFLTLRTARSGVWLLFLAAGPAARAVAATAVPRPRVAGTVAVGLAVVIAAGLVRGPRPSGASRQIVDEAVRAADGDPILAEPTVAEQVALAGGTIWLANPLDAFSPGDQGLYLDWLEGDPAGDLALDRAQVVLVREGGAPADRLQRNDGFRAFSRDSGIVAFRPRAR